MKNKNILLLLLAAVLGAGVWGGYLYYQKNRFYYAPRTETNLFTLGQIEANKGRHAEAIAIYKELLSKDPKHTIAMRFMIESMAQMPDRSAVIPTLDQLVSLDPSIENLEFAASMSLQIQNKEKADGFLQKLEEAKKMKQ